ncbi:MAG: N-acyl homoserine lactonase family protein [Bacteroidetes bacterium]|nr:N-acyl homoserine lactonase family protein [Bacteroidota bacterium]MDA1120056.1 N-acyl homoserine lactonase family protein [Bacteroidota bacterium]
MNYSRTILLLFLVILSCKPSSTVNNSTEEKSYPRVYVLDGGYMLIKDLSYFTQDSVYDGQSKYLDDPVFLIEHEKGRLIWDGGLPDAIADQKPEDVDTSFWIINYIREKLIDQLAQMQLTPDSIDFFSISHSHGDHVGNGNYFSNSTWLVHQNEYQLMMTSRRGDYDSLRMAKRIEFDGDYDVFGDSSVVILSLPGHTPGHCSLLINLPKSGPLMLSGDLYHFIEQRGNRRIPKFNTDVAMTIESMEKFEALVEKYNARVVIQHEREHYELLPKYPEYLE